MEQGHPRACMYMPVIVLRGQPGHNHGAVVKVRRQVPTTRTKNARRVIRGALDPQPLSMLPFLKGNQPGAGAKKNEWGMFGGLPGLFGLIGASVPDLNKHQPAAVLGNTQRPHGHPRGPTTGHTHTLTHLLSAGQSAILGLPRLSL
jgi:hypothetical protein